MRMKEKNQKTIYILLVFFFKLKLTLLDTLKKKKFLLSH